MKITRVTKEWLLEKKACEEGRVWFRENGTEDVYKLIEQLKDVNCEWALWLITRVLNKINNVKFAVFAAEQVLEIYEKQFPHGERPRKAIEAAKEYIYNPNNKKAHAADAARAAADAADTAAYTAADAADAAAYAAYATADTAAFAADAAYTAAKAAADAAAKAAARAADAADAAYTAADAAARAAAKKEKQLKIIAYGERLLRAAQEAKK